MEELTAKERLTRALEGQDVDHVPFSPFLAYVWESFPAAVQDAGQLAFHREVGSDPLWRGAACAVRAEMPDMEVNTVETDDDIVIERRTPVGTLRQRSIKSPTGNTAFLFEHPLKTEEDFKVQTWIEEHTRLELDLDAVQEHLSGEGREGLSLGMLIPRGKSAYQSLVEHHAGTEELIYALADFSDTVETLWQTMVEKDLEAVRLSLEAPYDYFITWEDSGTQNYSPRLYDKYIGSEIGQWCGVLAGAGKKYVQHACGHVAALVARMKAHGAHGIESVSPPPTGNIALRDVRQAVGDDFAIVGGIEPTQFLNLTLEELEPYVEQVMADGSGGPFVLANSDSCPPGVTLDKFKLVAEVAKRHRLC